MSDALARLRMPASRRQGGNPSATAPGYDDLPDPIKLSVTPKEWDWMTETQRANLVSECTEPEVEG